MENTAVVRAFWRSEVSHWTSPERHFLNNEKPELKHAVQAALVPTIEEMTNSNGRILDIAGAGTTGVYLPESVMPRTTVLDISHPALKANEARSKVQGNVESPLPFMDNSFSFVTMFFIQRYIFEVVRAMGEVYRVLEPGGKFIALDFSENGFPFERRPFMPHALAPFLDRIGFSQIQSEELYPAEDFREEFGVLRGPLLSLEGRKE